MLRLKVLLWQVLIKVQMWFTRGRLHHRSCHSVIRPVLPAVASLEAGRSDTVVLIAKFDCLELAE